MIDPVSLRDELRIAAVAANAAADRMMALQQRLARLRSIAQRAAAEQQRLILLAGMGFEPSLIETIALREANDAAAQAMKELPAVELEARQVTEQAKAALAKANALAQRIKESL